MKVVQFGLRFSPNLGDGVIAECLAHALRSEAPGTQVTLIDISGRDGFGATPVKHRQRALAVLRRLPPALRRALVRWRLGRLLDALAPVWVKALQGADLAIVGGGQILADADLNFPLKLARVAEAAQAARVPVAIHAAGVQPGWSPPGRALFTRLLDTDLRQVGLRDTLSCAAWQREMGGGPAPALTRDPGLLAVDCYGPAPASRRIGLCVTDPAILRYHADSRVAGGAVGFYRDLAATLAARGHKITLFCNGAAEDRAALDRVIADPGIAAMAATGTVSFAEPPERPADLARLVGGFRGVVAHRLHACILAWSYRVPVVGLGWDRKVESFFASVAAQDWFAAGGARPVEVADRLQAALKTGVDPTAHARVLGETRAAVAGLLHSARRRVKR